MVGDEPPVSAEQVDEQPQVALVDTLAGGGPAPDWYEHVNAWVGGLWYVASLAGALTLVGYGVTVAAGTVLPAWTGWAAVGSGVLMLGLFAITRDVPPFLLYVAPTLFGVTALIRAAADPATG